MGPPPEEAGETAVPPVGTTAEVQRVLPTPFLTKTYQIVEDPAVNDVISWNEDGSTFIVWRPAEFARDLLPKYFKHNNFSSFVRQLNTYGFRKMVPDRWEFANDCFRRGEKRLLCDIHRRKVAPPPLPAPVAVPATGRAASPAHSGDLSSNSSPGPPPSGGGAGDLADENDRLRRENEQLSRELAQMKGLCNNILHLMSNYAANQGSGGGGGGETVEAAPRPPTTVLELIPQGRAADEEDEEVAELKAEEANGPAAGNPRLFGVAIGAKRGRTQDEGGLDRPAAEVKSEPLDPSSDPEDAGDHGSWLSFHLLPNQRACHGS